MYFQKKKKHKLIKTNFYFKTRLRVEIFGRLISNLAEFIISSIYFLYSYVYRANVKTRK